MGRSLSNEQIEAAHPTFFGELVSYTETPPSEEGKKSRANFSVKPYDPTVKVNKAGVVMETLWFDEADFDNKNSDIFKFLIGLKERMSKTHPKRGDTDAAIAERFTAWWKVPQGQYGKLSFTYPPKGVEAPAPPADWDPDAWREANVGESVASATPNSSQISEEDLAVIAQAIDGQSQSKAVMAVLKVPALMGKYDVTVVERAIAAALTAGLVALDNGRYTSVSD